MPLLNNTYEVILPRIGQGKFSRVYKAVNIVTSGEVSIKVVQKRDNKYVDLVRNEIDIISKLSHLNIIKYIDSFEDQNYIYLVQELCVCDLRSIIFRQRNEQNVKNMMSQIKDGLEYLYQNKIFHRDLKPENILISEDNILKISDFGLSVTYQEYTQKFRQHAGTPLYFSLEIHLFEEYTIKSDLYSVGILFYELLYKFLPYGKPKNCKVLLQTMLNTKKIITTGISKKAKDLLLGLLEIDADKRIDWPQFFEHCWFCNDSIILEKENVNIKENNVNIEDNYNKYLNIIENYDTLETMEIKKLQNYQVIENYLCY